MKVPKVAIVHEWLVDYSGSERVVEQLLNIFPEADLFALVENLPDNLKWFIKNKKVKTSFIQRLPWGKTKYRNYFPLMPFAVEQFDLRGYDIVISSNHAVAKGVLINSEQLHITYCHSPVRYAWDLYHQYIQEANLTTGIKGLFAKIGLHYLRLWDVASSNKVDYFVANSRFISRRIKRVYNRASVVIYPPVATEKFQLCEEKEDYYLAASRFVPYKKMDLIVEAFASMPDRKLVVIGEGPDFKKVSARKYSNIQFLGFQPFEVLQHHMQRAKGFVFAAIEDFGITPVEAMACGTPVIAFKEGGAKESVIQDKTGVFFLEQEVEALKGAVNELEAKYNTFDFKQIRGHAETFGTEQFCEKFKAFVNAKYARFVENRS